MKTTKEAALALGVKPGKLAAILKAHPSFKPTATFGGRIVWDDDSINNARRIVCFVEHGVCPNCSRLPDGTAGDSVMEEAPADDA